MQLYFSFKKKKHFDASLFNVTNFYLIKPHTLFSFLSFHYTEKLCNVNILCREKKKMDCDNLPKLVLPCKDKCVTDAHMHLFH